MSELIARLDRWLYRGGSPNRLARVMVRFSARVFSRGWVMPDRVAALEVRGRRTGARISLPVVIADHDGERYLVSMLGENANWVRNVRAANGRAVLLHGRREQVVLEEVPAGERAPILRRYPAPARTCRSPRRPRSRSSNASRSGSRSFVSLRAELMPRCRFSAR